MIKINDQMSIKKYKYGWELHHKSPSKGWNGNKTISTRVTYHSNIKYVLTEAMDRLAGECNDLQGIITAFTRVADDFWVALGVGA